MPNPATKAKPIIPRTLGDMRHRRKAQPDQRSAKGGELQRRLGALEEEVRACRLLVVDIEDVAALADEFVAQVQAKLDEHDGVMFWPREWALEWASQFRGARARMINQDSAAIAEVDIDGG